MAAEENTFTVPYHEIGDQVLFYPNADPHEQPAYGWIAECDLRAGSLAIEVGGLGGRSLVRGVRHLSDPWHKNKPAILDKAYGAWTLKSVRHLITERNVATTEAVIAAYKGNVIPADIATKFGISRDAVDHILQTAGLTKRKNEKVSAN